MESTMPLFVIDSMSICRQLRSILCLQEKRAAPYIVNGCQVMVYTLPLGVAAREVGIAIIDRRQVETDTFYAARYLNCIIEAFMGKIFVCAPSCRFSEVMPALRQRVFLRPTVDEIVNGIGELQLGGSERHHLQVVLNENDHDITWGHRLMLIYDPPPPPSSSSEEDMDVVLNASLLSYQAERDRTPTRNVPLRKEWRDVLRDVPIRITEAGQQVCGICQEYMSEVCLVPCGHLMCDACVREIWSREDVNHSCPYCRADVTQIMRIIWNRSSTLEDVDCERDRKKSRV